MTQRRTLYERVSTMDGYVPPDGFEVVSTRELEGGLIEVTLEGEARLSVTPVRGRFTPLPFRVQYKVDLSGFVNGKRVGVK